LSKNTAVKFQGDDADDFNPDRFIDDRGKFSSSIADTKDGKLPLAL
jgi:hypothetical protein